MVTPSVSAVAATRHRASGFALIAIWHLPGRLFHVFEHRNPRAKDRIAYSIALQEDSQRSSRAGATN
jgi:hypothetical protein